jgi:hypothetical protein
MCWLASHTSVVYVVTSGSVLDIFILTKIDFIEDYILRN